VFDFSRLAGALPEGRQSPRHPWQKVFDAVFLGAAMQMPSLLQIEAECRSGALAKRIGPLSADTHSFTIQVTDSQGNSSTYTQSFNVSAVAPLTIEASARSTEPASALTNRDLAPIVAEAENRLAAVYGESARNLLASVSVQIGDLPSGLLGEESGKTIRIDQDAAGYGWFIDPTPADDSEFADPSGLHSLVAQKGTVAYGRVDLLTTVMHEMEHVFGYPDDHATIDDLMTATLPTGVRRTLAVDHALATLNDE